MKQKPHSGIFINSCRSLLNLENHNDDYNVLFLNIFTTDLNSVN